MSLFERFWKAITDLVPGSALSGREDALAKLNPERFYVENVRSVLGVSARSAQRVCDTAVRQGFFQTGIQVLCPDHSVAVSAPTEAELPSSVHCWIEDRGELTEADLPTAELVKLRFYRLNNEAASKLYSRSA